MTDAPRIRPAEGGDIDAISRIWDEGWRDAHDGRVPDALYRYRTPESYPPRVRERIPFTIVADRAGTVLGFVVVHGDELEQVYVDRAARGTGASGLLIAAAEARIVAAGNTRAWLAVVAANERALAFYEKAGWRDDGPVDYDAEVEGGTVPVPCRRYVKDLA